MSKKAIYLIISAIGVATAFYFMFPSDEGRIRKLFKQGSKAIEEEDLDSVMSKVSFNYRDEYGLTYLYLKESAKSAFHRMQDIKIEYENLEISAGEKTATADMDVRVVATVGNDTGYILGDLPNPVHLKFTLERERARWLVIRTEGLPFHW